MKFFGFYRPIALIAGITVSASILTSVATAAESPTSFQAITPAFSSSSAPEADAEANTSEATADLLYVAENQLLIKLSNAVVEDVNGEILMKDNKGTLLENLTAELQTQPGFSIEKVDSHTALLTMNPDEVPDLQDWRCGVGALSGGVAGVVATGLALAALGVATGGTGFAVLAAGGLAGYGTGAVANC